MAQSALSCPICASTIMDYDKYWGCSGENCPEKFKVWKEMSGYTLSVEDLIDICGGALTKDRTFVSKAKGSTFTARLVWDSKERKVRMRFPGDELNEALKNVLCPNHNVALRASEKSFYCPTKSADGSYCNFSAWRNISGHSLTPEELRQLLSGAKLGPWTLTSKGGKPYQATAHWSFDENKVKLTFVPEDEDPPEGGTPAHDPSPTPGPVTPVTVSTASEPKAQAVQVAQATGATSSTTRGDKGWIEFLPKKASQLAVALDLGPVGNAICEAAIQLVTKGQARKPEELDREQALQVKSVFDAIANQDLVLAAQYSQSGELRYKISKAA